MSKRSGVKVWRYRDGVLQFRTSSTKRASQDLALDDAELSDSQRSGLRENDWVLQKIPPDRYDLPATRIPKAEVLAVISDTRIPPDGDAWYFDGVELHRVYRRTESPDKALRQAEVAAAIDAEFDKPQLVFYRGDERPLVYHLDTGEWEKVEIESWSETLDVSSTAPEPSGSLTDAEELLLVTIAKRLTASKKEVEKIVRKNKEGDYEGAAKLVRSVVHEVITGAEPAPVQGHNVIHSMPGVINQIEQLDALARQQQSLASVQAEGRPTATGGFGTGVGLVDGTWQAVGSLTAFFTSVVESYKLCNLDSPDRQAKHGANARSRQLITVATHGVKGATTSAQAIEAIGKVAAFSTAVPSTLAPIAGVITGTIATVRSSVQADKSRRRMARLKKLLEDKSGGELHEDVQALLAYGMRKAKRKFAFKTAEATTGAVSAVASGVLIVGAVVAGANAWNPVGWGIGIAVFVAGAGLLTYKIVRKVTSDRRARKRKFTRKDYPGLLLQCYLKFFGTDPYGRETLVLHEVLAAYGVRALEVISDAAEVVRAEARIARHLA